MTQIVTTNDISTGTLPKPFVFILMPFDGHFDDIYKLGIRVACEKVGAYCERVDEQYFQGSILQRVYNQIAKADVIVADMTGRNQNVFYEVGYAHALGKDVILLTQDINDIPFDLKHHPHIVYHNSITQLIELLTPRILWGLEQQRLGYSTFKNPLIEFYIERVKVENDIEIIVEVPRPTNQDGDTSFSIDVHNPGTLIANIDAGSLAVVIPPEVIAKGDGNPVKLPDGRWHCELPNIGKVLPSAWKRTNLTVSLDKIEKEEIEHEDPFANIQFVSEKHIPLEIRHYQEIGLRTFSIQLVLKAT